MRVLVTGGTGLIGKAAVQYLIQAGHDVCVFDLAADVIIPGAHYVQGDILDYQYLLDAMQGCNAVVHMAAVRTPYLAPPSKLFEVNAAGTFNVFEAAATAGIKRVVQASSINAIGGVYSMGAVAPHYLPLDEDHPAFTTDPYSFSKEMIEQIGNYYWRRNGISSVALRFPGVYQAGQLQSAAFRQRVADAHQLLDSLLRLPAQERAARIADAAHQSLAYRSTRPFEYDPQRPEGPSWGAGMDPLVWLYTGDRANFWAFLDERDAAQAVVKALTADYEGAHPLFVTDSVNLLGYDTMTLIDLFFPDLTIFKADLSGSASLITSDRARTLIGFEPEFSPHLQPRAGKSLS